MSFTQELCDKNLNLFNETLNLPFNQELAQGVLAKEKFRHYIIQDAHYLVAYGRSLAITSAKAEEVEDIVQFSQAAKEAIIVERSLHDGFMKDFGISKEEFENTQLTPITHHYTNFLIATSWSESYPVALASLLPCFWVYAEVGRNIIDKSEKNNPYQSWIDTYAGEEFHNSVKNVRKTIDKTANNLPERILKKMRQAYTDASKLEYLFWDGAYNLTSWKI